MHLAHAGCCGIISSEMHTLQQCHCERHLPYHVYISLKRRDR